ncbi:protein of unknown function [Cupriavidus taiwanensis]|uniref:Uncharacterized protein n=1 Tax=Cupriavidus taiwanensis TaxID=164546 RepID=A0A375ILE6_9BURK|nr:hypothetical protein CBM2588_A10007 [Cupriavidus taiwanensis]SOZ60899.1 hypothetical protein CBM2617_A350008 [Cupriavidus taiwanensis]SOZ81079.1 hypothetical protein CBM2618_A310008 [Cupriavidus taiwanensis]SOZ81927.1 hypothetical protein CBM2622_A290008 [Cupriavidus taiwanensis]SOZ90557.1 hypothetical protein CBM2621_A300008 [Cupriavidus taiwanensis]
MHYPASPRAAVSSMTQIRRGGPLKGGLTMKKSGGSGLSGRRTLHPRNDLCRALEETLTRKRF